MAILTTSMQRVHEAQPSYCWPATLQRPAGVRIVYLDLNHWVAVAKALSGHPDSYGHRSLVRDLFRSVEQGRSVFPISYTIYAEMLKIGDRRRRSDLRNAIECLGKFFVVTSRYVIATHEIEALLDNFVGPNPEPVNSVDYLDWGIFRALGMNGAIRVLNDQEEDVTSVVRGQYPDGPDGFDRVLVEGILDLNRRILDGPTLKEEAQLRRHGYRPEMVLKHFDDEAVGEHNLARLIDKDPGWRKGRLRDVVSAREMFFQINNIVAAAAAARGLGTLDHLVGRLHGHDERRRAFDAMPSFDASVSLKTAIHRNAQHRWKNNHVYDIHALTCTLPYCDVVVTDREMASLVRRGKLDRRFGTTVLHDLMGLADLV